MSRIRGATPYSSNFEVKKAAPLDSKLVVDYYADLLDPSTWKDSGGFEYTYLGMPVYVANDADSSKGIYVLNSSSNEAYKLPISWTKIGTGVVVDASGTSWPTFQLNNDASGVAIKDVSGTLQIVGPDLSTLANFAAGNITLDGSLKIDNLTGALYAQNGNVYVAPASSILTYDGSIIGDGTTTIFPIVHNLNTIRQTITIWDNTDNEVIYPGVERGLNTDRIAFFTPPDVSVTYNITILGF